MDICGLGKINYLLFWNNMISLDVNVNVNDFENSYVCINTYN
jgi:hypothetical protein